MSEQDKIARFRRILETAIDAKEKALYPDNPLCAITMSVQDEETNRNEQAVLREALRQFKLIFEEIEVKT